MHMGGRCKPYQLEQSTGAEWETAAFGTAVPLGLTSQQRTSLSHDVPTSKLEVGLHARLEIPSFAAFGISASLFGL